MTRIVILTLISKEASHSCSNSLANFSFRYAWRRLKKRMRDEKGETVAEPELIDKWNSTTTNNTKNQAEKDDVT